MSIQNVLAEAIQEAQDTNCSLVVPFLEPGETVLAYQVGEQSLPFLLRVLPLPFVSKRKQFVLAITEHRVVIVEKLKSAVTQKPKGGRRLAAIPFNQIK